MLVDGHGKAYQALGRCGGAFETIKWWTARQYRIGDPRVYSTLQSFGCSSMFTHSFVSSLCC